MNSIPAVNQDAAFRRDIERDEALLRQALSQMEANMYALAVASPRDDITAFANTIAALRARLGETT